MSSALKSKLVAVTGKFGSDRSNDNLKKWIEAAGGEFATSISARVTHLVCSKEAWKIKNPIVKAAQKQKKIKIVNWDWLEDTCQKRCRQREEPYLMTTHDKEKADKKEAQKAATKAYIKEKDPNNYHYHRDPSGFVYSIVLMNPDRLGGMIPHYYLRLYETHTIPHQYALTLAHHLDNPATSSNNDTSDSVQLRRARILVPVGSTFVLAFSTFRHTFLKLTNVEWDFRIWSQPVHGLSSDSTSPERSTTEQSTRSHNDELTRTGLIKVPSDWTPQKDDSGLVRMAGAAPFPIDVAATIAARQERGRIAKLVGGWSVRALDDAITEADMEVLCAEAAAKERIRDRAAMPPPPPRPAAAAITPKNTARNSVPSGLPTPVSTPSPPNVGGYMPYKDTSCPYIPARATMSPTPSTVAGTKRKMDYSLMTTEDRERQQRKLKESKKHHYTYTLPAPVEAIGTLGMKESGQRWFGNARDAEKKLKEATIHDRGGVRYGDDPRVKVGGGVRQ